MFHLVRLRAFGRVTYCRVRENPNLGVRINAHPAAFSTGAVKQAQKALAVEIVDLKAKMGWTATIDIDFFSDWKKMGAYAPLIVEVFTPRENKLGQVECSRCEDAETIRDETPEILKAVRSIIDWWHRHDLADTPFEEGTFQVRRV